MTEAARFRAMRPSPRVFGAAAGAIVFLIVAMAGAAVPSAVDSQALIDEVVERSGMGAVLDELPGAIRAQAAQATTLPADVAEAMRQVFAEAYEPARLHAAFKQYLQQHADVERLARVRDWLQSPLATEMTKLELAASGGKSQAAYERFLRQFDASPVPPERLALVRRIDQAVKATEFSMRMAEQEIAALMTVMQVAQSPGAAVNQSAIDDTITNFRQQHGEAVRRRVLARLVFIYRPAPDAKLAEYLAFWESDLGQWFHRLTSEAFLHASSAAANDAADRMGQLVLGTAQPSAEPASPP